MANTDFRGLFLLSPQQCFSSLWYKPKKWFHSLLENIQSMHRFSSVSPWIHPSCIAVALRTVIGWLVYGPKLIGWAWFRVTDAVGRFWVGSSCWPSSESNNPNLSRCTTQYRPDQEGSSPSASSGRPVHQDHRTSLSYQNLKSLKLFSKVAKKVFSQHKNNKNTFPTAQRHTIICT